ncbi:hypothetical protein [Chroococcidiopsis sp.]|uniref:hypothetical protein n=1 Tax=Chroococcidiopsis sp. TaxID=3088168 RepID=UPI003F36A422
MQKTRNIGRPVGFGEKEMEGYFMISNQDAAVAIINKLSGTQLRLWLYLMMVDSFADTTADGEKVYHEIPSPAEIALKIGANAETVEKDMRVLRKHGLYDYRVTAWGGHNHSAANARRESDRLKQRHKSHQTQQGQGERLNNPPSGLNNPSERLNNPPSGLNNPSERLNNPPSGLNNPQKNPKAPPDETSSSPQTIQTYSDFIQTLSEDERANFLNFCSELTANLSQPVNDIEAWLAHKNKAGKNRWEVYYQKFLVRQGNVSKKSQSSRSSQMMKKFQMEIEQQQQQAIQTWESQV